MRSFWGVFLMENKFEQQVISASLDELQFLLKFYFELLRLGNDPISVEVQLERVVQSSNIEIIIQSEEFAAKLIQTFKTLNYERNGRTLRILPNDYVRIISEFEKQKSNIEKLIRDAFPKEMGIIIVEEESEGTERNILTNILRKMYEDAPPGYQMTMLHLFGIKYASQIQGISVREIARSATGKESLAVEIGKGMKLADFVDVHDKPINRAKNISPTMYRKNPVRDKKISIERFGEEIHTDNKPEKIVYLYKELREKLVSIDYRVTVKTSKTYIGFRIGNRNFCDVLILKTGIKVWVSVPSGQLVDRFAIFRDCSQIGRWGNGDYDTIMTDRTNLEYIVQAAKQAFDILK